MGAWVWVVGVGCGSANGGHWVVVGSVGTGLAQVYRGGFISRGMGLPRVCLYRRVLLVARVLYNGGRGGPGMFSVGWRWLAWWRARR